MQEGFWIFAAVVLLSFTVGAFSGFGSVIIALAVASHFFPIEVMVPRLVALNVVLNGYLSIAHRGHVAWHVLLKELLPWMMVGCAIGVAASSFITGPLLEGLFGVLVVLLAASELYRLYKNRPRPPAPRTQPFFVFLGGLVQGIYASGGPLVVYTLAKTSLDRFAMRSTLAVMWLVMNMALFVVFLINGRLNLGVLAEVLWLVPIVVIATVIGELLSARVNERVFRFVLFSLLLVSGGEKCTSLSSATVRSSTAPEARAAKAMSRSMAKRSVRSATA